MKAMLIALLLASQAPLAEAQGKPTVESLVKEGYEIVSVFPSSAGPGVMLEFADDTGVKLMMCFVAETKDSPDITTQYCKPVR